MTLAKPTPTRMKLPPTHLTFSASCQMREVYVSDDAEYERAAKGICSVAGYGDDQYPDILHNLRILCCPEGERAICPPVLVAEYYERMGAGYVFPPLEVVKEEYSADSPLTYWVFSGFTRGSASLLWELPEVECLVYDGTREDAEFYALSENRAHGMRTGYGDKSKAVRKLVASKRSMARCRAHATEKGGGLCLAMATACGVSSNLVTHVLRADGLRIQGMTIAPIEEKPEPALVVIAIPEEAVNIVVVASEPEPAPPIETVEEASEQLPLVTAQADALPFTTPELFDTSEEGVSESHTPEPTESAEVASPPVATPASNGQLPPLVPHRYAALMAGLNRLSGEFTKAIRAETPDGARLRECFGACLLLDFVPEKVDEETGQVTPKHVDFLPLRGLARVLDLAGGSEAKVAKIKHAYDLASGGFVPPAHVRRRKVKSIPKKRGEK